MSQQRTYSSVRVACPACKAEGRDSQNNHCRPMDDRPGWGYCLHGHGSVRLEGGENIQQYNSSGRYQQRDAAQEMALVATYPIRPYPPRKISQEAMEFFGIRTAVSQEDGTPAEHWYPYYDEHGSLAGYKCRLLPKTFRTVGKIKTFFGQQKIQSKNFLLLVEGEHDCPAAYDMMRLLKPERSPYNVASLPHGADENVETAVDKVVKGQLEWLSSFKKIVLLFDQDVAGRATANALADYLCAHTEVAIASFSLKDTAAMWEAGREREWANAINNAKRYVSDQIILGSEGDLESLLLPLKRGIHFSFIPRTCNKLRGFRTREMTTLIAPPKCGKSSLLRQMIYEALMYFRDEAVGGFFLEETDTKTKQSIIAMHAGVALNDFRANPACADKHLVQEAYDTLLPRLHLFKHKGKTISDDLLERKIDYLVKTLGCKTVAVDHSTFVIGTRETVNERQSIDHMLTRLARSVEDEDYRLFVVAHIKRGGKDQSRIVNNQKYPYWEILSMDDARGSGAYEQLSHNMVALEKQHLDPESENTRGLIRTRILLSREWGVEGIGDYLSFNEQGKFCPVEVEY